MILESNFVAYATPSENTVRVLLARGKRDYKVNQEPPEISHIEIDFVEPLEVNYINKIERRYSEKDNSERWYIYNDETWVEIDPSQLWFWTKEWQSGEDQVDEEYRQGLAKHFNNIDDLLDSLLK